jgi:foldase protein PrsA
MTRGGWIMTDKKGYVPIRMPGESNNSNWNIIIPWILFGVTLIGFIIYVIVQLNAPKVSSGNVGEEAVAIIDDEPITANEVYEVMLQQVGRQTVDGLIIERLIERAAKTENIEVTEADLNTEIDKVKSNFGSEEEFNQQLESYGLTLEALKAQLTTQVQLDKLIAPKVQISDEILQNYYDENKETYTTPEQVQASHILVETKEEANEILELLKGGADFATLAQERSKDPGSGANGGDLGFFGRGQMVPPFEEAAFTLEIGQLSEVVESEFGFHIIKVVDKKPATTASFEEKKEEIKEMLTDQRKNEVAQSYIEELKAGAKIENFFAPDESAQTNE